MFGQFKEKLHLVQQDLSASLKTLSTKAKEVKISRRDELTVSRRKNTASSVCNYDAGAELLERFQQIWSELHMEIETSAEKAMAVDRQVQQIFVNFERRAEPLSQFQRQLADLPRVVENIQHLTASVGKLEADFEEVESMLSGFVDLIEHCELIRNKQTQTSELARYTHQKLKEEELMEVRLQEEYDQHLLLKEQSQRAGKMERQQAFQDVFSADMDHYRTHGEMQCILDGGRTTALSDISSVENFEMVIDDKAQEALNEFLDTEPGSAQDTEEDLEEEEEEEEEEKKIEVMAVVDSDGEDRETIVHDEEVEGNDAPTGENSSSSHHPNSNIQTQDAEKEEPITDDDRGETERDARAKSQDTSSREEAKVKDEEAEDAVEEEAGDEDEFDTPEEGEEDDEQG